MRNLDRRKMLFIGTALAVLGVMVAALAVGRQAEAGQMTPPKTDDLPALPNMAVLANRTVPLVRSGQISTAGLPAPRDGEVRLLLDGVGKQKISLAAWAAGKDQVCYKSSAGGGGCFENFDEPFIWTISDPDGLRNGEPLNAWGFVPDTVSGLSVDVNGAMLPAVVENNAVFVSLTDERLGPEAIRGFEVTFRDGTTRFVSHAVDLPSELR